MAENEEITVTLSDAFYREGFKKLLFLIISASLCIIVLIAVSIYLHVTKPKPILFRVGDEYRVQADVPVNQPYMTTADLLQWVTEAMTKSFVYDFINYQTQLQGASQFFTNDGWTVFLNQLNNYVNYNNVQTYKLFVSAAPTAAPVVINQGLLSGRYAWWVQIPMLISYAGYIPQSAKTLTFQVLVVRVPTANNLNGVGIDNVIVATNS